MKNNALYYQESGRFNPLKLSFSYAVGVALALILGYIYSLVIVVIPIIYANVLITFGYGLLLGLICRSLVRFSQNRSKRSQIIQAVVIGLLANYFQWTAYILYAYNGGIPTLGMYFSNLHWIMLPKNFFALIFEINRLGTWSVFGVPFNGFMLTAVWLLEFIIIAAGPILSVIYTKVYPYSELLEKWYHKYTLFKDFESVSAVNQLIVDLTSDPLSAIDVLGKGDGHRHIKIHIFYLKNEEIQYLTLEKILIEGQGRGKRNSSIVLNNFKISKSDAERILDKYENKRERFEVI